VFQKTLVEKIKAHILCSISFLKKKSCRLRDKGEKYGRARQVIDISTVQRMRFACWINKATDTHSEYRIISAFPLQQLLRQHASMLHHTCIAIFFCKTTTIFVVKKVPPKDPILTQIHQVRILMYPHWRLNPHIWKIFTYRGPNWSVPSRFSK
jgi:hypothetical protein